MNVSFFPDEEYQTRLAVLRRRMRERDLDAVLISSPENIYYLAGLNHQGFFAYHLLLVPQQGNVCLIARAMEHPTIEVQVPWADFVGYPDTADPVTVTRDALWDAGLGDARLGIEKDTLFLPPRITEGLAADLPDVRWSDISGLVDEQRLVKSPRELAYVRQAADVADVMMRAAIETVAAGVSEQEIAAEVHRAMILAGGEYPGFGPFIRATPTLPQEHVTWSDYVVQREDVLFVELAGCVKRYHAPMGRLLFVGEPAPGTRTVEQVCLDAFEAVTQAMRPGVKARDVYGAWQATVDRAGFAHYRRHHCGYSVGIGFPPSWVGGNRVIGLRHDSDMTLQAGMTFHLMSWLMGTGRGDYFVSDAAILTEKGCDVLTSIPQHLHSVT